MEKCVISGSTRDKVGVRYLYTNIHSGIYTLVNLNTNTLAHIEKSTICKLGLLKSETVSKSSCFLPTDQKLKSKRISKLLSLNLDHAYCFSSKSISTVMRFVIQTHLYTHNK